MGRRRELSVEEKKAEGAWLKAQIKKKGITQVKLADDMDLDNPGNIAHWARGGAAIPDPDLLWLGKYFESDVISLRPRLAEYAQYFEGNSILKGLTPDERQTVTDMIELIFRRKSKEREYFVGKTDNAARQGAK